MLCYVEKVMGSIRASSVTGSFFITVNWYAWVKCIDKVSLQNKLPRYLSNSPGSAIDIMIR